MKITRALITVAAIMMVMICDAAVEPISRPGNTVIGSKLGIKNGASLVKARFQLLKRGWQPIRMHSKGNDEYDGAEKRLIERGFMEVDSCSIDRGANCILYYRKGSACLRLDTVGEQVTRMKISSWTAECPSKTK